MRIALAQINYHVGNFDKNTDVIIENIKKAREQKADLIVFSELSICGYPPRDFLDYKHFINSCEESVNKICSEAKNIAVILGAPSVNPKIEGKNLFNSAYFIEGGQVKKIIHKTLLPTYDVFDEYRYFEPNKQFETVEFNGKKIAITICEDLWNVEDDPKYIVCPMDELMKNKPDLMINIAASPFNYTQRETRRDIMLKNVAKYKLPLFYLNHVGTQTELIFDGGSTVYNSKGVLVKELDYFKEAFELFDLSEVESQNESSFYNTESGFEKIERIYEAICLGIKDYFKKSNFEEAILGLSGGIDSAVTMVMAAHALGAKNVEGILMPSQFSSSHSITDSELLCKNLGSPHRIVKIEPMYDAFNKALDPSFKDLDFDVTEENIQSRIRGLLLMAFSNKFGDILLNTSNKSELAVGYGTLYGDMCGGLSVLGDIYKTEVYELAEFINRDKEIIPRHIIDKEPSAELRHDQKDSDSLPPYDTLDAILFEYIENWQSIDKIIDKGYDAEVVKKVLRLVNINEFKRHQFAPILRVSPKAFGMGRRMPIVAKYLN
ncbi:MAG: NAD+ synthase [Bacteroidia bacterium]|nr:NAD+ synthase [Bacteroidia bacterium]